MSAPRREDPRDFDPEMSRVDSSMRSKDANGLGAVALRAAARVGLVEGRVVERRRGPSLHEIVRGDLRELRERVQRRGSRTGSLGREPRRRSRASVELHVVKRRVGDVDAREISRRGAAREFHDPGSSSGDASARYFHRERGGVHRGHRGRRRRVREGGRAERPDASRRLRSAFDFHQRRRGARERQRRERGRLGDVHGEVTDLTDAFRRPMATVDFHLVVVRVLSAHRRDVCGRKEGEGQPQGTKKKSSREIYSPIVRNIRTTRLGE